MSQLVRQDGGRLADRGEGPQDRGLALLGALDLGDVAQTIERLCEQIESNFDVPINELLTPASWSLCRAVLELHAVDLSGCDLKEGAELEVVAAEVFDLAQSRLLG